MKYIYIIIGCFLFLTSCAKDNSSKEWAYQKTIKLDGVNPIGIAEVNGDLWLSDGDHNRLVQIDYDGNIEKAIDSLDRPMHIESQDDFLFVPEYGRDVISSYYLNEYQKEELKYKKIELGIGKNDSLDAPASISRYKSETVIADFYNNRILYNNGVDWISFGHEGSHEGEFYYPTDVQLTDSLIWVADAYNNRIQVFDKKGKFVKMMGQDQKMNAATGLFVSKSEVFITDFENKRVLVFNHEGVLKQELKEGIEKATDLIIKDNVLHIINYRSGELVLYDLQGKTIKT